MTEQEYRKAYIRERSKAKPLDRLYPKAFPTPEEKRLMEEYRKQVHKLQNTKP